MDDSTIEKTFPGAVPRWMLKHLPDRSRHRHPVSPHYVAGRRFRTPNDDFQALAYSL
jgi:hypothetical protein